MAGKQRLRLQSGLNWKLLVGKVRRLDSGAYLLNSSGRRVPSVHDLLRDAGLVTGVAPGEPNPAVELGREVAEWTSRMDKHRWLKERPPEHIEPFLIGWREYRNDSEVMYIRLNETPIYSAIWDLAGTPDRVMYTGAGRLRSETEFMIVEIKTGRPQPWHDIQACLYTLIIGEVLRTVPPEIVYLSPDGRYRRKKLVGDPGREAMRAALACVSWFNWRRKYAPATVRERIGYELEPAESSTAAATPPGGDNNGELEDQSH